MSFPILSAILDAIVIGIWTVIIGLIFFTTGVSVVPGTSKKRMNLTILIILALFTTIVFVLLLIFVPVLNFSNSVG